MKYTVEVKWNKSIYLLDDDGEMIGSLMLEPKGSIRCINNATVSVKYRNMGFYRILLETALRTLEGVTQLASYCRLENANRIYTRWTGKGLSSGDPVYITLQDDKLIFNTL